MMSKMASEVSGSGVSRIPAQPGTEAGSMLIDAVDTRHLLSMVNQNRRVVLLTAVAIFALVMAATLLSGMQFRSSGRLYLGELDTRSRSAAVSNEFEITGGAEGDLGSEIEIIKSRSLITQAILKSGVNVTVTPSGRKTPRYWQWLLARRDPDLLDIGLREIQVTDAVLSGQFRQPQAYVIHFLSDTEFELLAAGRPLGAGRLSVPLATKEVALTVSVGTTSKPTAGARYDVLIEPVDDVLDGVTRKLEVSEPKSASPTAKINVLSLEYSSPSPRMSVAFLEQLMQGYLAARQAWKTEDAGAAEVFVSSQLKNIRESLDQVQQKLAEYRTNNRVVVLDNEAKAMIEQIGKYEEQRLAARLQAAALSDIQRTLKAKDPPLGAYLFGEAKDTVLEQMSSDLAQSRQKIADLETKFNSAAPEIREQRAHVEAQLDAIRNYVASRVSRSQESLATLNGIISQFEQKLKTVPGAELGLAQLSRESEVYSRTYSYLLERQQQAGMVKASRLSKNRVLDAPRVPVKEDSPKLLLRLASGPIGLLLGVAIVLTRSLFSGRVQSEFDVRRSAGSSPVWVTIPRRRDRRGRQALEDRQSLFDIGAGDENGRFIEAFRALRSTIYRWLCGPSDTGKIILITSPDPGDGKTTCTWWLAAALAADGKKVIRVDADLRKPAGPSSESEWSYELGLRGVLAGECHWREVVGRISSASGDHFSMASGGRARPEVLSGERMAQVLKELREVYDFVLVDSPAFPFVSDALALTGNAHAVFTVVRLQHSDRAMLSKNVHALAESARQHAIIINDAGADVGTKRRYPSARPDGPTPVQRIPGSNAPRSRRSGWRPSWWAAALAGLAALILLAVILPQTRAAVRRYAQHAWGALADNDSAGLARRLERLASTPANLEARNKR